MKNKVKLLGIAFFAVCLFQARPTHAADFSMNMVISDDEMQDYTSMSAEKIQAFLELQTGVLKTHTAKLPDGTTASAATILYQVAQTYRINPKVILTTIQKESSMLTRTTFTSKPAQWYLDRIVFYSWCDSCTDVRASYLGFYQQIDAAVGAYRRYLDQIADPARGYTISGWGPGIAKSLGCIDSDAARGLCTAGSTITITPVNASTAALYTYTPHPGGNYSFWSLWNQLGFNFRRVYPDGSLLRAQGGSNIYLIQNGVKRRFANSAAFLSRYSFNKVITVTKDHLFFYDDGRSINFANYSLLATPQGGIYLLADDTIRPIKSQAAFKAAGFSRDEVVKVSWTDLDQYATGTEITTENIYPSGQLMQNKTNGMVFFIKDGVRHPVPSRDIFKNQFGKRKPIGVSLAKLETYTFGDPVGFRDGELITSKKGGTAYFISNGKRLPIASWEAAKAYHFDAIWKNLIATDDASIAVHPVGQTLDVAGVSIQVAGQPAPATP